MTNYIWGFFSETLPSFQAQSALGGGGGTDVWQLVAHAGFVVQLVLFMLIAFSVLSWAVILSKFKIIRQAQRQDAEFQELFWHAGSLSAAYTQTKHLVLSPMASVLRLGFGELGKVMRAQGGEGPLHGGNQNGSHSGRNGHLPLHEGGSGSVEGRVG